MGTSAGLVSIAMALGSMGCDLTKLTANSTSKLFERASPAFQEYWDWDTAGEAVPATIIQMEGILRVVPENERILLNGIRSYVAYGYGWVEDWAEQAELRGDLQEAAYQRRRAQQMYLRARDLGKHRMSLRAEGWDEAMAGGLDVFEGWLNDNFTETEDAVSLLWTGYAWGSYINVSRDNMEAVADLAFAKALVERSVALDPNYYYGAGLTFLAVIASSAMGADLDAAGQAWERALAVSERRSLLALVNMAKTYAVKRGDRELYVSLLREVLEAGDVLPESRLSNRIAKRRAARYLRQVDRIFE